MRGSGPNFYARLGVSRNASPEDIRKAFRKVARRLHPDVNPDPQATELFIRIQEAYHTLLDPEKREAYDASLPPEITCVPNILVNTLYSRSAIAPINETQLIYILLDMMPNVNQEQSLNLPLNISLVLDCSTSMHGERMDMAKIAAVKLLRQMRPKDILSIVAFSDRAEVILPARDHVDISKGEIRISMLSTGGGTEIYQGLQAAYQQIETYLSPRHINHIILLTDGHTYGDENACLELARQAARQGVGISVLGIGSDWNDAFSDQLAAITGGQSIYIANPKDLQPFLNNMLAGLEQTFVEQVMLNIHPAEHVELRYAFRLKPEANIVPLTSSLYLGPIPRLSQLSVLLEFYINALPSLTGQLTLAEVELYLKVPTAEAPPSPLKFKLARPIRESDTREPVPRSILQAMSSLTLYRLQEQAKTDLAAGKSTKARERLQQLASRLSGKGYDDLANTVLIEATRLREGKPLSPDGSKQIKYGTRALLMREQARDAL